MSRAPEDSDPIYNYFLVNIWIQVNPEDDFSVRYVSVSAEPESKPLYFYVLRYSPTTSSGSVTHGFNLGFDLGVSSSGPSGSVGVGYSSGITMPMLETIDDSDLYTKGIKWKTDYTKLWGLFATKHSHWTEYSILVRDHGYCYHCQGRVRIKVEVKMDENRCTLANTYVALLKHIH